jgi:AcrR family transcriptional regulator
MHASPSKSETNRQTGKHQVDEQRVRILDAAEWLFLQNGLENTRMVDIAAQAGITKVTLYRYFPNRDVIALEIQVRMLKKIASLLDPQDFEPSLACVKKIVQVMIRNFDGLRDAYRYVGMFDKIYLDNSPEVGLTHWTKDQLISWDWNGLALDDFLREFPHGNRVIMIMNTVIWFLEKLALRGELTWSDQSVPLEAHLKLFEDMILGYIEACMVPESTLSTQEGLS